MTARDLLATAQGRKDSSSRRLRLLKGLAQRTMAVEKEMKKHRDEVSNEPT